LGLHRKRARHLVACARTLAEELDGEVPTTVDGLMDLPFVGRYAANAIACVAYDAHVAVIDANVARIYRRVFSLPPPPERLAAAHDLWDLAARMLPRARAKPYNWAILDLGGQICTAKAPGCDRCPIVRWCDHGAQVVEATAATKRDAARRGRSD
jgi:A/G-specific adenine glycosylase